MLYGNQHRPKITPAKIMYSIGESCKRPVMPVNRPKAEAITAVIIPNNKYNPIILKTFFIY